MHYDYFEQAGGGFFDPPYLKQYVPVNHYSNPNIQYDSRATGDAGYRNAWVLAGNASAVASHRPGNGVVNAYIEAPAEVAYYQNFVAEVVYSCDNNYSFEWRVSRDGGQTYSGVVSQSDVYNTSILPNQQAIILRCQVSAGGGSTVAYYVVNATGGDPSLGRKAADEMTKADRYMLTASPNPVQNDVTISFVIPEAQTVHLSVVNIQGNTVYTLPEEIAESGTYTRTLSLKQLPAGSYIVRLATPQQIFTKKLVITP